MNWYKQAQQEMNILFLDDDASRTAAFLDRIPDAVAVQTAEQVIAELPTRSWDVVCLDHDLGGEFFVDSGREDTGAGVARWIAENKPSIGRIIIHSHNPDGAKNMEATLARVGYNVVCIPFATLINQI